jgi:hypothetical protein
MGRNRCSSPTRRDPGYGVRFATLCMAFALLVFAKSAVSADPASEPGISKDEATKIAARFVANEIRVEAAVGEPVLKGDNWEFPLKFGYRAVVHRDPVVVNRRTGEASWAGLAANKAAMTPGGGQGSK